MRIRSIKPEFWKDRITGRLSVHAKLLYIGMWNFADDHGRFLYEPDVIAGELFPFDRAFDVDSVMQELLKNKRILLYYVGDECYGQILKFTDHQHPNKPSKSRFPEPDQALLQQHYGSTTGVLREYYGSTTSQDIGYRNLDIGNKKHLHAAETEKPVSLRAGDELSLKEKPGQDSNEDLETELSLCGQPLKTNNIERGKEIVALIDPRQHPEERNALKRKNSNEEKPETEFAKWLRTEWPDIKTPQRLLQAWETAFPGVNIEHECRAARAWELANPKKQKTNHARFLNGWLSRQQDRCAERAPALSPPKAKQVQERTVGERFLYEILNSDSFYAEFRSSIEKLGNTDRQTLADVITQSCRAGWGNNEIASPEDVMLDFFKNRKW